MESSEVNLETQRTVRAGSSVPVREDLGSGKGELQASRDILLVQITGIGEMEERRRESKGLRKGKWSG